MDLVLEIGCEELPAGSLVLALDAMMAALHADLGAARLLPEGAGTPAPEPGSFRPHPRYLRPFATPRRLALTAEGLLPRAPDAKKTVQGPPAKAAFGPDGAPTKAGEGFARKLGVPASALRIEGDRVVVDQELKGSSAREALPRILEQLIAGIPFRKAMRWGDVDAAFARPVHWIAAALDGELLPVRFADVTSALSSRGHRFHAPAAFPLPSAQAYAGALRDRHVLADWAERKRRVWDEVTRAAAAGGGEPLPDDDLLETVTGLVEEPSAVLGHFEPAFLELPPEVLVSEMRGHQKYFAVRDARSRKLLPAFVAVSNTRVDDERVSRRGYERVLRARLSDGKFFFDEDRKTPLTARLDKLSRITFFQGMGTQAARVQRLGRSVLWLHDHTRKGDPAALARAASLCKADLTTGMVGEFPDLQGTMGRVYALAHGEPPAVADALFEHYLPRGADDGLPAGDEGALLGIADRLDQLVGFFGLGKEPSGTADPYGLRRAAIGLIRLITARKYRFDLKAALEQAQQLHAACADAAQNRVSQAPALIEKLWGFLCGRAEVLWRERAAPDAIQAVLATGSHDLVALEKRLDALTAVREKQAAHFEAIAAAFKRIGNILSQARAKEIAQVGFHESFIAADAAAERELAQALSSGRERVHRALSEGEDYAAAYAVLAELRPRVDRFFDDVMVMDPDPRQRDNRLALLRALQELFAPLADFARLQSS
ncbi:MAG: glycine--tRNA ligase subunit beta [Myxococcales bacterium]